MKKCNVIDCNNSIYFHLSCPVLFMSIKTCLSKFVIFSLYGYKFFQWQRTNTSFIYLFIYLPFRKAERQNLETRTQRIHDLKFSAFSLLYKKLHFGKFTLSIKCKLGTAIQQNARKYNEGTMHFLSMPCWNSAIASGKNQPAIYKPGATQYSDTCWTSAGKSY